MTEEIARLIDRAVWALGNPYNGDLVKARVLKECLDALRALALERDVIRAKTFEECAQLADDRAETFHTEDRRMAARDVRNAIRARAQKNIT